MYVDSKTGGSGYSEEEVRLAQLMAELKEEVQRLLRCSVSISPVRAGVSAIAKHYPEFVVWAGEVRWNFYVVTIWINWVGDGEKIEKVVVVDIPKNVGVS